MIILQKVIYYIIYTIKITINLLAQIYHDKKIRAFFQQTNFVGNLEDDYGATMVFIAK